MLTRELRPLETPKSYFSRDASRFRKVFHLSISDVSSFYWETDCVMVYVRSGMGSAIVNGMTYPLIAGDLGVLHSFHIFAFSSEGNSDLVLDIVLYPYPELVLMTFASEESSNEFQTNDFYHLNADAQKNAVDVLQLLEDQFSENNCSQLVCNCLLSQLMYLQRKGTAVSSSAVTISAKMMFEIAANSFSVYTPELLCEKFRLPAKKVNYELRRSCGTDFRSALTHSRISNAYSMILRENLSMFSLAIDSGFPNESSFYRSFKDYFGKTPLEYKDELRQLLGIQHSQTNEEILSIESYILNHFREDISVSAYCGLYYTSPEAVNNALRKKYGGESTFATFLNAVRLRYSVGLLSMSDIPIIDVALDSGFNSVHTFIRSFKKSYQMTPTEFRSQYRRKE